MSPLAIVLVVVSAVMHAGWNLLGKSQRPRAAFLLVASTTGAVMLSPVLVWHARVMFATIPAQVWLLLVITGLFMALYYVSLAGAYRAGDLSVAYPLARSSPVIVVAAVTFLLGRGEQISTQCIVGIGLVVGGCFLIPLERFGNLHLRNYLTPTCGLALMAAVGTSGYSIADDEALRQLREHPLMTVPMVPMTLAYACLQAAVASCWMAVYIGITGQGRADMRHVMHNGLRHAGLTGAAIHFTYAIVLVSLAFADNVSYVVGLRQLSIPLGTLLGIVVLKEPRHPPKLAGAAVMFIGLVLVALG